MFELSNTQYDFVKKLITIVVPAALTLYVTICQIFEFGGSDKVVAAVSAVTLFLGVTLGISSKKYNAEEPTEVPYTP